MNKQALLQGIADAVSKKHPHKIPQEKYLQIFGEYPKEFIEEKLLFDNLAKKALAFEKCNLILSSVKIEINLTLHELIIWELNLDKWEEARLHNVTVNDIKKILK